jgi:hypothetical protein
VPVRLGLGALAAAAVAGALGYASGVLVAAAGVPGRLAAVAAIAAFGIVYLGIMHVAGVPETAAFTRRLRRRR